MIAETVFAAMGSDCHVVVRGEPGLVDVARMRVDDLERRWSRFRPDSEVSLVNAAAGETVGVSAPTFALFRRALDAYERTGGRFDPTILGDLVRAGYDRPFRSVAVRPGDGLSTLRRNASAIVLDPVDRTVTLPPGTGFDPGGIGKGLAADLVVGELLDLGAEGVCVNLGGDVRVEGAGPDGRWVVAVDVPGRTEPVATLALDAGGVATSTTRLRAWQVGTESRHHLIDPETGRPLDGTTVAVTAVARDAAWAEVATKAALFSTDGVRALVHLGCDGIVVDASGDVRTTPRLSRFLVSS